ncbi:reprolysin-like metallopeptidase [Flavobacterium sp. SM2513]|uniref:zinc-dependent metalloprotease n=1 Tax=Flavobacterium sp. SM2513 TaxID=3424766 RepID=UPI003D7F8D09
MNKKLLLNLILIFTIGLVNAQNSLWTKTSETRLDAQQKFERTSGPKQADFYTLNFEAMKAVLQNAPTRDFSGAISSTNVSFPNANGVLEQFSIYESSVMEPELAANHPEIQSYVGQGITNRSAKIYLTTTVFGLHAMILSDKGTYYIDPFTTNLQGYIVYNKANLTTSKSFTCYNTDEPEDEMQIGTNSAMISDGLFRTYRLAMACTIEYAAYHVNAAINAGTISSGATEAQKKSVVLAAMNVTVSRVNSVYESDMSLKMQLVANNESIIFITSDNFENNSANILINQSQSVIDATIGASNYDIGHTVSTGGGGLAQSPSVCTSGKARGITGSPGPVGDPFDIDYVAHEMGHQFGASHTFNNSCGNNRAPAQAVEPGSGSTIMAYAGICAQNVQGNSDVYFHAVSIGQMSNNITLFGGNCAASVASNNATPVVENLTNYTIPKGTPFVLTGAATDDSASAMTYCWEQTNPGASTAIPSATAMTSNPNFRSFTPILSPKRYFPSIPNLLAGNLSSTWEVIPNVGRTMNFGLTVRDNSVPNGGQSSRKNMTVTFNASAGPFKVTSQSTNTTWLPNQSQIITWDVAGTTSAPVSTANVKILLSTDGGYTYDTVLLESTPNDGSQAITVPNVSAPFCRVMVQPVDNVYFAINSATFTIGEFTTTCVTYNNVIPTVIPDGAGPNMGGAIGTSVINVPVNYIVSDVNVGVNISHSYIGDLKLTLRHPDNTGVVLADRICNTGPNTGIIATIQDGGGVVNCSSPVTGSFSPTDFLSTFNGKATNGNWTLEFQDFYNVDQGTLNSWSIEVCYLVNLSAQQFELNNLTIAPNPNSGNFNVKFNSTSNQDVLISVYDISGRQIFAKSYPNQSVFTQNIQLDNVQAGVYLVNVQDGTQKSVRKIVVQ